MIKPPLQVLEGEVVYNFGDQVLDILSLKEDKQRRKVRGVRISHIPQGSMSVLNPVRRIKKAFQDIIEAHLGIKDRSLFAEMVKEHLDALGLDWGIMQAFPHQLSGGMRQRLTIALATILKPDIIFADEPTTALDVVVQRGVVQLIKTIKKEQQNTLIMVTHDLAIHANLCDRLAIMYAGKIVEEADIDLIFGQPKHPYTLMLLKSLPKLGDKSTRGSAPGAPPSLIHVPSGCRFHPRCPEATERCRKENPELIELGDGHQGRKALEGVGTAQFNGYTTSLEEYLEEVHQTPGDVEIFYHVNQPVYINNNLYLQGAVPFAKEETKIVMEDFDPEIRITEEGDGVYLTCFLPEDFGRIWGEIHTTKTLQRVRMTDADFANPDGSGVILDLDYLGEKKAEKSALGPIADLCQGKNRIKVWR